MNRLEIALAYAAMGWHVLPVLPGKKIPASEHGVNDATTDSDKIKQWFSKFPNLNIGIATGKKSGIIVVDVDPRNGGDSSIEEWLKKGQLEGVQALTAGGGTHYVLSYEDGIKSCKLDKGIDLLSDGRYFVAYPSKIDWKKYEWEGSSSPLEGVALEKFPAGWLEALRQLSTKPSQSTQGAVLLPGARNIGLTALAGVMRRYGMTESEISAALHVANENRCCPALPHSDVDRIIKSVCRYDADTDTAEDAVVGNEAAESLLKNDTEQQDDVIEKLQIEFGDSLGEEYLAPDELIEGLITLNSLSVLYGDSNSGKTFFALSLAAGVAEGKEIYGRKVEQGIVVYLATESPASVRMRVQAIKKHFGYSLKNLAIVPVPLNFYKDSGDARDVILAIKEIEIKYAIHVNLVIGDTMARLSAGANENSGQDMAPIMARFEAISSATGAAMLLIHHSGKDSAKGARGWSGIRAHIETEIEVTESNGTRCAKITKQRELPTKGDEIFFDLRIIEMGISKFGGIASTCVAVSSADVTAPTVPKKDSKIESHRKIFENAWWSSGAEERDGFPYLSRSALIDYLVTKMDVSETSAKQYTKPSLVGKPIADLLIAEIIAAHEHGWIVIDNITKSTMLIRKSKR